METHKKQIDELETQMKKTTLIQYIWLGFLCNKDIATN